MKASGVTFEKYFYLLMYLCMSFVFCFVVVVLFSLSRISILTSVFKRVCDCVYYFIYFFEDYEYSSVS